MAVSVVFTAGPTQAAGSPAHHQLQTLCQAGGGAFALARFDTYRCQDARTDGMGVFWAERTTCERAAGRSFLDAINESTGRGTWLCVPALD
jgi:hypothetical protein